MRTLLAYSLALLLATPAGAAGPPPRPKKIVILAGRKSHGPEGNGIHDYGWSARLIQVMLSRANVRHAVRVEVHHGGWPRDPATLDDADAVMVISDGRDGDRYEEAPHLASPERVRHFDRLMKRGCGLVTFHFSTFAPQKYSAEVLRWSGGYFQWEQDGKRDWYSAIKTLQAEVKLASPDHPVSRGVKAFTLREEFYYNLRFAGDKRTTAIATVADVKGRPGTGDIVAWARQRDRGRAFGTTCGHFYDNWKEPAFRKLVLNGLVWAAGVEVPKGGVEAAFYSHEEIRVALGERIRVLLLAGNEAHKWHNWEKTTPRLTAALERDGRIKVDVSTDIEDLAKRRLSDYQVILLNSYCNWEDPKGLSAAGRKALLAYLKAGGGLVVVHFANGAFHPSLPKAGASDWPEYRKIVRRVWDHRPRGKEPPSGHDAFGRFTVLVTKAKHPITEGLARFEVVDELYFRQAGDEPITPLLEAESKVTKRLEPLAWAYDYGPARVFQTLLGHSERTWDAFEAREMLRRAVAWAARQPVRPLRAEDDRGPEKGK